MTTYEFQQMAFCPTTREYYLDTMTAEFSSIEEAQLWARRNGWSVSFDQKQS